MALKLYAGSAVGFLAQYPIVVAKIAGVDIEEVILSKEEKGSADFKKKNLTGKTPFLEVGEGEGIFESGAIVRYLARLRPESGLYGTTVLESAHVDQWMDFTRLCLADPSMKALIPVFGYGKTNEEDFKNHVKTLKDNLRVVETHLKNNDYLVGKNLTIADIQFAAFLVFPMATLLEGGFRKSIPRVTELFTKVASLEPFVERFGRVRMAAKPMRLPPQPKEEVKKEAPKPAAEPKKEEKKAKNPLEELPPTKLDLDDFKRFFLNHKNKREALDLFFKEQFDAEGWSFWLLDYDMYDDEGQKLAPTNNLLNGFLQRNDPQFGRFSFGVHAVFGEEPKLAIRGIWMWRGTEVAPQMKDHAQFEYYKNRKLDHTNEADRKLIYDFWTANEEDVVDGQRMRTRKYQR